MPGGLSFVDASEVLLFATPLTKMMKLLLLVFVALSSGLQAPQQQPSSRRRLAEFAQSSALALAVLLPAPFAFADGQTVGTFKLPPIKEVPGRCAFQGSAMGQANAARDSSYDLRKCDMSKKSAEGFDLSGAILSEADFSGANFKETQLSKAYARNSNFQGADFSNGVVDRVTFDGSDMKNAIFANAVLTGTSFEGSNLENVDFTEAYVLF